jgi:cyclic beta-1,2-glucan synthetase
MALIQSGYHDRAYRYYQMINPINRSKTESMVEKYRVEPYVIAADIYSSTNFPGRGGWTWYTGSAGWYYHVGVEEILGIHKHGNKIKIDPRIPISWDGYKAIYKSQNNTIYNIEVIKSDKNAVKLDGKDIISSSFTLVSDGKEHNVLVSIHK